DHAYSGVAYMATTVAVKTAPATTGWASTWTGRTVDHRRTTARAGGVEVLRPRLSGAARTTLSGTTRASSRCCVACALKRERSLAATQPFEASMAAIAAVAAARERLAGQ